MKVLVTPRSFAKFSKEPIEILESNGFKILKNPKGSILTEQDMISLIEDVDAVIVGVDPVTESVLKTAKNLKVISKYGVGTDNIESEYALELGIPIEITSNANTEAVADYAFTLICSVARRIVDIHNSTIKGDWSKKTALGIYNKTIGIVGYGAIGRAVAQRAKGFNMSILIYDPYSTEEVIGEKVDLETLLIRSDFVSIHTPLTDQTYHLINEKNLKLMKETAIIVNTARGAVIDENALFNALNNNNLYGAGIDVFEAEPPSNSKLLSLDNVIVGNHTGASTIEAVDRMGIMASQNVVKYFIERNNNG